jgi:hypothetical protein
MNLLDDGRERRFSLWECRNLLHRDVGEAFGLPLTALQIHEELRVLAWLVVDVRSKKERRTVGVV